MAPRIGKYPKLLCIRTKGARSIWQGFAGQWPLFSFSWVPCVRSRCIAAKASTDSTSVASKFGASRLVHEAVLERGANGADGAEGGAAEAYTDRAFPASEVTMAEIQGAIKADAKLEAQGTEALLQVGFDRS